MIEGGVRAPEHCCALCDSGRADKRASRFFFGFLFNSGARVL